jgi:hypothetical protein
MKKLFYGMAALALLLPSCDSDQNPAEVQEAQIDMSDFTTYTNVDVESTNRMAQGNGEHRTCFTMENLNRLLNENPGLEQKMYKIEYQTRKYISKGNTNRPGGGPGGGGTGGGSTDVDETVLDPGFDITIPVYVHIILPNADDVKDDQINAQIKVLNDDFNTDYGLLPSDAKDFVNDVTTTGIHFSLTSSKDQIIRHNDPTSQWGTNDAVKKAYPPITPETHLNIWVCNIGGGILGYAQFPGGSPSTDGIVLLYSSLPGGSATNYNLGRTATHEVGHYLNLRHIWGDGPCKFDDYVLDTPSSDGPNYGCPKYPTVNCKTDDMTMNYMDYTYDSCMYMFTDGQTNRMHAIFQSKGPRASMAN